MSDLYSTARLQDEAPERFVRLRAPLGVTSFGINQMVLEPRQQMRIHRHTRQEEVYVVLSGQLTLGVEGEEHTFGSGELVRVAPGVRRQLLNRGEERVSLLALGGDVNAKHDPRDAEAFLSWDGDVRPVSEVPVPEDLPA